MKAFQDLRQARTGIALTLLLLSGIVGLMPMDLHTPDDRLALAGDGPPCAVVVVPGCKPGGMEAKGQASAPSAAFRIAVMLLP